MCQKYIQNFKLKIKSSFGCHTQHGGELGHFIQVCVIETCFKILICICVKVKFSTVDMETCECI